MKFEKALIEVSLFNTSDIVVTSGGSGCDENCTCFDPIGGGLIAN